MKKDKSLKIIPLGGLREIGKNMTVFEYDNDIIIVDAGLAFPEDEMLGIDIVIPDISYLEKNKNRIKGLFLTHGHEDHIGAIAYVLKRINPPIYGTRLTLGLVGTKLREHHISDADLNIVKYSDVVRAGCFQVEFIKTGHSIPDSASLAINTPIGRIVHTGDFKIDYTPIDKDVIDLNRLAEIGNNGVLALMSDSTNATRPGYTVSERSVGKTFKQVFSNHKGRIIVATFASNIHRIQQIITASEQHDRKVVVSGRSMENTIAVSVELGYLNLNKDTIIDIRDMKKYPPEMLTIVTTGSQGEPMSALTRIASGNHRKIQLQKDDLVIISASPIPGNEVTVSRVIDNLVEKGTKVIYEALADVHVSGHACQEELKLMLTLVKPKFFIPVHGEYRHLEAHADLAREIGIPDSNIVLLRNGDVLELTQNKASIQGSVTAGNILVDGLGIGDVGNIVLRDRKHLSEDGLIVVVITMSKLDKKVVSGPNIISRGFVYVRESGDMMEESKNIVQKVLDDCESKNITDWNTIKSKIKDDLREYIFNELHRNPMILPIIMEA